ncbi:MAG: helix-turn-helix transcriptional regulator [Streptococcus suis]
MNRLKELRQEKKLSQKELAKKIGVHYRTLQNWENGESQIKPDKAQALADYFGVSVGYLLGFMVDEVSEGEIEFHNRILSNIRKSAYIGFLDYLATSSLTLSNHQINAIFNQIFSSSEINDEYRLIEEDSNKHNVLFSIARNYIPQKDISTFLHRAYTPKIVDEQIKKVEKILSD